MKKILFIVILSLLCWNVQGQELFPTRGEDGKWGFVDKFGATVIPFKYDWAWDFAERLAPVALNGKWGYIDQTEAIVIPFKYDAAYIFSEGLAPVELNSKWGYIDKTGVTVIPFKYDYAAHFSEGLALAKLNGKHGYIDQSGVTVIPFKYDDGGYFFKGLAAVQLNDKSGYIDKTGKEITPVKYDDLRKFSEGLALVKLNGKWGYINQTGKEIVPFKYDDAGSFVEGLAAVELNGKYGYIDQTGKEIVPFKYDDAGSFVEELSRVKLNDKYGYIDKTGKEITPLKYDDVGEFSEGLVSVKLNGKWGFIDKTGKEIVPFKYDDAGDFSEGLAGVGLNGKWGFVNKTGKEVLPVEYSQEEVISYFYLHTKFSPFAKAYIEPKINEWQKKGEFEKTADWQKRVTESTRKEKINEYLKEAEEQYLQKINAVNYSGLTLKEYDADNESFLAVDDKFGQLLIAVPHSEAPLFKANWYEAEKTPKYYIENDKIALAELAFTLPDGKTYKYSNQHSIKYATSNIAYNFDPIDIEASDNPGTQKGSQTISVANLQAGKADVDTNIPASSKVNDKTFAVIIANENYQQESKVEFAASDGATFKKYCTQTLGLPENNVHYVSNATLNNMRYEVNWISQVAQSFNGEANLIFYYAGHGIPDEDSKTAYLLPVDGYGSDVKTGYKLDNLYQKLGALPAQSIMVFMDACFSGAQRSGEMLASARGVAIKTEQGKPSGNMVVFSAAQGDETAYPYREKGHGLFTYFLLKKLQESKGEVTLEELSAYITTNVRQQSIVVNRKSQTPTVIPSPSLVNWQGLKLK